MKCQKCQKETFLPFKCPYCENYFCSEHRLPGNHECQQMELARTPIVVQKQEPYEYTITYVPVQPRKVKIHLSNKEITHLTIAAFLVAGVGLSMGSFSNFFYIGYDFLNYVILAVFIIILTTSFFLHEIAHKIAAQRQGLWAEFRLTLMGAILTLVSIITPLFKIISPGAVMISEYADIKNMGKTSIAGPMTNITLSTAFFAAAFLFPLYDQILALAAFFNAWIAFFNLIPLGILDGFKVFQWDKKNWTLAITASLILMIISYNLL